MLVERLLALGADAGLRDSQGETALDYAELCEYTELAARLVRGGCVYVCLRCVVFFSKEGYCLLILVPFHTYIYIDCIDSDGPWTNWARREFPK